ncbi:hypothetical protein [uncultured Pelagimonas sp.]|uniref:hypothetical protein n=1 Tax=uncultured Pelagimonas sp. TaxID=1618102 RepID=UPI002621E8FA|nr:hypothetical protein [uncultured Pelagimonas sp.]
MDKAQELKVMQAFYDRIFEMVTYSTGNSPAVNDPSKTLVQLVTDGSINLSDFKNMASPNNPAGDLTSAEAFYDRFNITGGITPVYTPSGNAVGKLFKEIVDGADATVEPSKKDIAEYKNAMKFLHSEVKTTDPLTGKSKISQGPSPTYTEYLKYQKNYADALANYRATFLNYDLSKPKQQEKFEAKVPILENAIQTAWENWNNLGAKSEVEEVLAFLASSDNNIVANVINDTKSLMASSQQEALVPGGGPWWLTSASPSNFYDSNKAEGWMSFSLNSNYLHTSDSSYMAQYQESAGSSFLGLIGWSEKSAGKTTHKSHHMQGNNLSITGQMMTVTIERPWYSSSLFNLNDWKLLGQPKGWVSEGNLKAISQALTKGHQEMPVVPTAFVIVKDLSITANWTTQDSDAMSTAVSASGGCNFGPFHSGGSSSSSSSHSTSTSTFSGGTLSMPDPQIVAFVNHITPLSPPEAG